MALYNVHLYREMRLTFRGIEAASHEAAAAIARERQAEEADDTDDCDGQEFAALVDVAGDEEYTQSRMIDFEPERLRKAAPEHPVAPEALALPAASPRFEPSYEPEEAPDRFYVLVDGLFDVAIIRTDEGIVVDVYPKDWMEPLESLTVWEDDIAGAEAEANSVPETTCKEA
ncbi:hypothetical protein [Tautonia marina]|uniref:hypothetical protein n=1 Tax=Tautonia marina TaxID=2653855 RepID=UPI0012611DCF|nr:hypothetical protein [Tautonia marina]